jgi:hypothetical protein
MPTRCLFVLTKIKIMDVIRKNCILIWNRLALPLSTYVTPAVERSKSIRNVLHRPECNWHALLGNRFAFCRIQRLICPVIKVCLEKRRI